MAALLREENGCPAAGGRKMAALQLKGLGMAALQLGEENGRPAAGGGGGEWLPTAGGSKMAAL
jgi:hypothetical protein